MSLVSDGTKARANGAPSSQLGLSAGAKDFCKKAEPEEEEEEEEEEEAEKRAIEQCRGIAMRTRTTEGSSNVEKYEGRIEGRDVSDSYR